MVVGTQYDANEKCFLYFSKDINSSYCHYAFIYYVSVEAIFFLNHSPQNIL